MSQASMAYKNTILPPFTDGPSDVMRITILGSLRSLHHSSPGCCQDAALQTGRDPKVDREVPTRVCLRVDREVPTRDCEPLTNYSKNVHVRYFKNIRDRLRSKYYACGPQQCAGMKARQEQHERSCRRRLPTLATDAAAQGSHLFCCSMSTSPIVSRHRLKDARVNTSTTKHSRRTSLSPSDAPYQSPPGRSPSNSASTNTLCTVPEGPSTSRDHYTPTDFDPATDSNETRVISLPTAIPLQDTISDRPIDPRALVCHRSNTIETNGEFRCIEDHSFDPEISLQRSNAPKQNDSSIKHCIHKEVDQWLRLVPIPSNLGAEAMEHNASEIRHMIRNLVELSRRTVFSEQDQSFRSEIEKCINNLPVWYPHDSVNTFKIDLIDHLMTRLKVLHMMHHNGDVISLTPTSPAAHVTSVTEYSADERRFKDIVIEWLWSINMKTKNHNGMANNMSKIADLLIYRMNPLLDMTADRSLQKTFLINAIISVLHYLPININCPRYRDIHLQKFAEDLFDRLHHLIENSPPRRRTRDELVEVSPALSDKSCLITPSHLILDDNPLRQDIRKCLREANIRNPNIQNIASEIEDILENFIDAPFTNVQHRTRRDITRVLAESAGVSDALASLLAKELIKRTKAVYCEHATDSRAPQAPTTVCRTKTVSVFTSEVTLAGSCRAPAGGGLVTSTPKKPPKTKTVTILNSEEKEYMEKVLALVRAWVETLPETFSAPDERDFKETIIRDLAGDVTDAQKLAQLTSDTEGDRRKYLKYIAYRWIHRLEEIDIHEVVPQIDEFLSKLDDIPVPNLTSPRGGNRQEMANIVHAEGERGRDERFLPRAVDILQDEISLWMNRQASDIFTNNNYCHKNNKIRELAQILENKLASKRPPAEISRDVAHWLHEMVAIQDQQEIAQLAEDLKDRVIGLPQDATLATKRDVQQRGGEVNIPSCCTPQATNDRSSLEEAQQENAMKMFIDKFIEHNYDVDDHMARVAANQLLKLYLIRLSPPARDQVYDNNIDHVSQGAFPSRQVMRELEYIKDISEWLNNLPIDQSYNTIGNRERIDFVTNLAANIRDVEEQRKNDPDAMDYNLYMAAIISEHMGLLPMHRDVQKDSQRVTLMIDQLLTKIIAHREAVDKAVELSESTNTTGINTDNIGDFIEEFIVIHGNDVADNELKMEIWALRLMREIKKALAETLNTVSKGEVYYKCVQNVPFPGDETAILFNRELEYIDEICNWMKNLPLLPISETEEHDRGTKICELAEKIIKMQDNNPSKVTAIDKNELEIYLTEWISQLPLDNAQAIVYSVVTEQLLKRIEKVEQKQMHPDTHHFQDILTSTVKSSVKVKKSKSKTSKSLHGSPEQMIIDIIEKWAQNLPLKAENDKTTKAIKDDLSVKLIQIVGELNMDPNVLNDDLLYQDILSEHIHKLLDDIPSNCAMARERDDLEADVVNPIMAAKNIIQQKTAGDTYKLKLENTVVASMPDPDQHHQNYDPGFEMYKNRLASAFILDNFDHSLDEVKVRYENNIKKEIDKYFEHAQKKNSVPLSQEELYSGLYVELYKVPIPNEVSVVDAVEEVKTRCEVDAWFDQLPLREAGGLGELLEWDLILATLAKRIHEIEKSGSKPDPKIKKEILKWLAKLPLLPEHQNDLDKFAETLLKALKNTAAQRKCVLSSKKSKGKKDKTKTIKKDMNQTKNSEPSVSDKKAADVLVDIVQNWCNNIPVCLEPGSSQAAKDFLVTKIMIKLNELNADPSVLGVDALYDRILNDELDILLSTVETCESFKHVKDERKRQLLEEIKSVMPLIKQEITHQKYKETLDKTVQEFLQKPQNITGEKEELFNEIKAAIIDDFVQYKYGNNDHLDKHSYKVKVEEKLNQFLGEIVQNRDKDKHSDYKLIKTNELMSELANIPAKGIDFTHDIEEIKMKHELTTFYDSLGLSKTAEKSKVNQSKAVLANKLNEIEMQGYTPENESKMKQEIIKTMNRLNKDVKPLAVDAFISKLRSSEAERRATYSLDTRTSSCQQGCNNTKSTPHTQREAKAVASTSTGLLSPPTKNACCQSKSVTNYDAVTQSPATPSTTGLVGSRAEGCAREDMSVHQQEHCGLGVADEGDGEWKSPRDPRCHCKRGAGGRRPRRSYCIAAIPLYWQD